MLPKEKKIAAAALIFIKKYDIIIKKDIIAERFSHKIIKICRNNKKILIKILTFKKLYVIIYL